MTNERALPRGGSGTMPAFRRRPAAKRAATPSASGCKARRLTSARRPDFAAFAVERLGLALRIGAPPEHARANQWQQITKRLPPQLNRTVRTAVWPVRRLLLPACAILPSRQPEAEGAFECAGEVSW